MSKKRFVANADRVEATSGKCEAAGLTSGVNNVVCHRPCDEMRKGTKAASSNEVRCRLVEGHCYVGSTLCPDVGRRVEW